ncbi:alpha/beta hydrolase [Streptomyces sp. NPDC093094]|uniref:alpha/beta hydrolase n=1 Tax=Streptomyces sp. NPDC093094 TaxID=3366026 RepID=UPI00380F9021
MDKAPCSRRSAIVLVHGAWFQPAVWTPVAERLREDGFDVAVPRLHRGSLAKDSAAVLDAVERVGGRAVMCGHSYGGAVITNLPDGAASHLVYLAAVMPTDEETPLGMLEEQPTALTEAIRPTDEPGVTRLDPRGAARALFGMCSPDQAAVHAAGLVPQEMSAGDQSPERVAWRRVPSTYVVCDVDNAVSPEVQRRLAKRATHTLTWHSDHTPFLREPDVVAALVAGLAAGR